jgi:hypothetical protein
VIDVKQADGKKRGAEPAFHLSDVEIEGGEDGQGLDEGVRHVSQCDGNRNLKDA